MKPKDPEKLQSIHRALLRLVGQVGLAGLTMAAIGKEAGIGMGTLYTYYDSKESLINGLFKALKASHTERIFAEVDTTEPYAIIFRKVFISYIGNRISNYEEHFFLEQAHVCPFLDTEARQLSDAAYGALYQLLDIGKAQHLIKPMDNVLLGAMLVGSCNELSRMLMEGEVEMNQTFIDQAFSLAWDAVKR